jgi:hypothetical protein
VAVCDRGGSCGVGARRYGGAHHLSVGHHVTHALHPGLALSPEHVVNVAHPHLVDGSTQSHHHEESASGTLGLELANAAVMALAVAAALAAVVVVFPPRRGSLGRGPPSELAAVVTVKIC